MAAVIAGCTSSLKNTSQLVSAAPAVTDRPTMKRPMAKSAEGGAAAPRMSQKVARATGGAQPAAEMQCRQQPKAPADS